MFTNAKTVFINNKEVKSIITNNNEILYENSPYNLSLTSNHSIIQSGETTTFSATLTNNNVPIVGETIVFEGLENTQTLVANTETTVGNQYKFTNIPSLTSTSERIYLNEEQTVFIGSDGYGNTSLINLSSHNVYIGVSDIDVNNGVISFKEGITPVTIDISSTNTNKITSTISDVTIEEYEITSVTDANGVASLTYTGKGVGDITVQADWNNTVQSNTLTLEDCYFYRQTVNSSYNDYMIPNINIPYTNHFKIEFDFTLTNTNCDFDMGLFMSQDGTGANIIVNHDELTLSHYYQEFIKLIWNTNYHLVWESNEENITVYLNNQRVWSDTVEVHYDYDTLSIIFGDEDILLPLFNFKIINIE